MDCKKKHGLQGPIDDAFLSSFLMVTPSGKPINEAIGAWTASEQVHAIKHWRQHFRGHARIKTDTAVTEEDINNHNLILWETFRLMQSLLTSLPVCRSLGTNRVSPLVKKYLMQKAMLLS